MARLQHYFIYCTFKSALLPAVDSIKERGARGGNCRDLHLRVDQRAISRGAFQSLIERCGMTMRGDYLCQIALHMSLEG